MSESFKRVRRFTEIRSANYRSRPGTIETVHEWVGPDAVAHDLTEHDLERLVAEHSAALAALEQLRAERGEARDALAVAAALLDRFSAETPCTEGGDTCRVHGYARKPCPHPLARQFVTAWRAVEADAAPQQPARDGKAER